MAALAMEMEREKAAELEKERAAAAAAAATAEMEKQQQQENLVTRAVEEKRMKEIEKLRESEPAKAEYERVTLINERLGKVKADKEKWEKEKERQAADRAKEEAAARIREVAALISGQELPTASVTEEAKKKD